MEANANANAIQFPAGLRVLAVDDDINGLNLIQKLCTQCHYHVTPCSEARVALNLLMEKRKSPFDLILCGLQMSDMDGLQFLQHVNKEINLPLIMMSEPDDATTSAVTEAVTNGACDFLIKPLREEQISNIWQHVVRRAMKEENITSLAEFDRKRRGISETASSVTDECVVADATMNENSSTEEAEVDQSEIDGDTPAPKKSRVVWSDDLHRNFLRAVNQLGVHKAVPTTILELMNTPDLTRDNVASHLQKFRNFLKGEEQQQNGMLSSFQPEPFGFPNNSMQNIANSNHSQHQNNIASPGAVEKLGIQENNVQMNNTLQHQQQQQLQQQTRMQRLIHSTDAVQSCQTSRIGYDNVMLPQSSNFSGIAQFPVENNNKYRRSISFGSAAQIQQLQNTSLTRSSSAPIITQVPYGSSISHTHEIHDQAASVENSCTDMIQYNTQEDLPFPPGYPS